MKKILFLMVAVIMLFTYCSGAVSAAVIPGDEASPMWDNISSLQIAVTFDGNTGRSTGIITGNVGTSLIRGRVLVYKQLSDGSWYYLGSVSDSAESNILIVPLEFDAVVGGYYKTILIATVYDANGDAEPETMTSYRRY